jgi:hypothetical protein
VRVELSVPEAQLPELDAAWREIVGGKRARMHLLEREVSAITRRALEALGVIETAIRRNPSTGQAGRLVRFLAGVYNGYTYPFDLTDLRALDVALSNACLDYLNYDRLGKHEVHHHLSGGERDLHRWIQEYGIKSRSE